MHCYTKKNTLNEVPRRFSVLVDQLSFIRDIEYTGRIIVNITRREGFVERFGLNHTGYIFRRRRELENEIETWNAHRICKSKHCDINGRPMVLYHAPFLKDKENYSLLSDNVELNACADE